MEFGDFLSMAKWQILEIIARTPSSPVLISEKIGTSVAYVSQQLKLLEAAGIVKKKRTGKVDKGKPRLVYSITEDVIYFAALINGFPQKRQVKVNNHKKAIMKIWIIKNEKYHSFLEKLYWRLEHQFKEISGIYVDESQKKLKVFIVSESKKVSQIINSYQKETKNYLNIDIINEKKIAIVKNLFSIIGDKINSKGESVVKNEKMV